MPAIHEIFASVQGEGSLSGRSAIFIRLSGCSLRCPYCDTREAWVRKKEMGVAEVLAEVDRLSRENPVAMVVLTGGEPLEQDLLELVVGLSEKKVFTAIETNGLHFQDIKVDWWTVSPKDMNAYQINEQLWPRLNELKLLVTADLKVETVLDLAGRLPANKPIFLQPCGFNDQAFRNTLDFFNHCNAISIPNLRLGLQLHRFYRIP